MCAVHACSCFAMHAVMYTTLAIGLATVGSSTAYACSWTVGCLCLPVAHTCGQFLLYLCGQQTRANAYVSCVRVCCNITHAAMIRNIGTVLLRHVPLVHACWSWWALVSLSFKQAGVPDVCVSTRHVHISLLCVSARKHLSCCGGTYVHVCFVSCCIHVHAMCKLPGCHAELDAAALCVLHIRF